jgi:hypothetical protein
MSGNVPLMSPYWISTIGSAGHVSCFPAEPEVRALPSGESGEHLQYGSMAKPMGTADALAATFVAGRGNVNSEEYERFGGTIGRSIFRPGMPQPLCP